MPAEWTKHMACLILYPHNTQTFRSSTSFERKKCDFARREVRNVARAIAQYGQEDVVLFCNDEHDVQELTESLCEEGKSNNKKKEEEEKVRIECTTKLEETADDRVTSFTDKTDTTKMGDIIIKICKSDDTWARDTGPTFVVHSDVAAGAHTITTSTTVTGTEERSADGNSRMSAENNDSSASSLVPQETTKLVGLDWKFNAYGGPIDGCYWPCTNDEAVASTMCQIVSTQYQIPIKCQPVDLISEGGSIHTDGEGTILTTAECLLHPNRNPNLTKSQIEHVLLHALGCNKVIWLPHGLHNDEDTNGHVDNIACFVKPGEIVLSWTDDNINDGENYKRCRMALEILKKEVDAKGREIVVHKLMLPPPMYYSEEEVRTLEHTLDNNDKGAIRQAGQRLAASYVNFYIANNAVIVPQFGHEETDLNATRVLRRLFPDRKVVGVYSREILLGGGNIHCITQQVPSVA